MATAATRRALLLPGILAAIGVAILIALGVWQLQRLAWKDGLIAEVESRTRETPIPAPGPADWAALADGWIDYRPLTVSGSYLHDDETHVFAAIGTPRGTYGGPGYWVVTPLKTDAGWYVLVNRGFVPQERKDPATRAGGNLDGPVTITGIARPPEQANMFTPNDEPEKKIWFRRDPKLLAAAVGLPQEEVAPYTIDAAFDPSLPEGLPQGGETRLSFPNNHLQYALTWFALAVGLAAVFGVFAYGRLKRGD